MKVACDAGAPLTKLLRPLSLLCDVPIALQAEAANGDLSDVVTITVPPGMEQLSVVLTIP